MDKKQAMDVIKQVAATFKGTLQDHQTISLAIQVIESELKDDIQPETQGE